jgi:hypothetical protein
MKALVNKFKKHVAYTTACIASRHDSDSDDEVMRRPTVSITATVSEPATRVTSPGASMPDKPVMNIEGLLNANDEELEIVKNENAMDDWEHFKSEFEYREDVNDYIVAGHVPKAMVVHRGISASPKLAEYREFFSDIDPIRMVYMEKTKYKDREVYCCIICCYVGTSEKLSKILLENDLTGPIFWILAETSYDVRSLICN